MVVAWGSLVVAACGGTVPPPSSPPPPQSEAPRSQTTEGASEEAPAAASAPAMPEGAGGAETGRSRAAARTELQRAQADLEASAGECAGACRALASMERATEHLCQLSGEDDDRRRCDDARKRLSDARDRVRRQCGACAR
jgi:hypothetical protein